ncbi:MAG: hypothetical protein ACPG7W_09410 [Paracoccaceae bacterium]
MRAVAVTALLLAAGPVAAQQMCLTDHTTLMDTDRARFDAAMQTVSMAHLPIEYRSSCGQMTQDDHAYYAALAKTLKCTDSPTYHTVFGQILEPQDTYLFAATPASFSSADLFDAYCALVSEIDIAAFVTPEGEMDDTALEQQFATFQDILSFVSLYSLR